jgi:hypothetical protein
MPDSREKQKLAGLFVDAKDVDVRNASIDPSLSKVWSDDATGELAVSLERVLFDGLLDISARFLEPHGFSLNLENLLAIVDSMRLGVFATTSSKPASDGRLIAKKLMPILFMHLPRKNKIGPLLQRFYDEIGRYETELARLQDVESKSKKAMESAIRDESGRKTAELLRLENEALREELSKMGKRLAMAEDALRAVPTSSADNQLPVGVRSGVVRAVRPSEGNVLIKSGDNQYSVPLKTLGGLPTINARALAFHEGGVLRSVWIFDPKPEPFTTILAEVVAVDGRRAKLRFADRREQIVTLSGKDHGVRVSVSVLATFARGQLIDLAAVTDGDISNVADAVYDKQTKRQLESMFEGGSDD